MSNPITPVSLLQRLIWFSLNNKLPVFLLLMLLAVWGILVAPFDWQINGLQRNPVAVDAIPDLGENQQIVFSRWPGHSPQDIEDQVSYPLTAALLGLPGVRTVRSFSMFGFSSIYVIFKEDVEFYWSRSRILEKLSSLSPGTLPEGVTPVLGPDATALGQVFWYTLEGRDEQGNPAGGWDLQELRSLQDWTVRFALNGVEGISEVASIGGHVQEYQIDVDPDALRAWGISLAEVFQAVRMSNLDIGARTIEINSVEYIIRGVGFIKNLEHLRNIVLRAVDNVPVTIGNIATISSGPALRRGILDKGGAEAVGGVVVVRYGDNPLTAIKRLKERIAELAPGLPTRALPDGRVSKVTIVPFYDRSELIYETLGTLNTALGEEILITTIVVLLMLMHFRSSLLIAGLLPLAVLTTFIAMKQFGVDANIVALSGIAIAIGTMVDMGIVLVENIQREVQAAPPDEPRLHTIYRGASDVGGAVVTAVSTTIVSFLPVFTMEAAEGKLFKPLAFTKTFALLSSILIALVVIPPLAHLLFRRINKPLPLVRYALIAAGLLLAWRIPGAIVLALPLVLAGLFFVLEERLPEVLRRDAARRWNWLMALMVGILLTSHWLPLGPERGFMRNLLFVTLLISALLGGFALFQRHYPRMLRWSLDNRPTMLGLFSAVIFAGMLIWLGFGSFFGWLPRVVQNWRPVSAIAHAFPGLGKEFMPPLDEGAFLYMPTTMPHASIGEAHDVLQKQDMSFMAIPEIASSVGKLGRAESPLDPAPVSMIETIITYHPPYLIDAAGKRRRYRFAADSLDLFRNVDGVPLPAPDGRPYQVRGAFLRDNNNNLIPDEHGAPFRLWRPRLDEAINPGRVPWPGIRRADDIWDGIVQAGQIPGSTSAPRLQPIAARLVMLQSGMRAPMGIKIKGPDLASIEETGLQMERILKEIPSIEPAAVLADRIIGKPYLEIRIDRAAIARYGIHMQTVQNTIEVAIGGKPVTNTVEGRERYAVRVRYPRELRESPEDLQRILVPTGEGAQIPLGQLAEIVYVRGPQAIKSEDSFLTGYVVFDKKAGYAEVEVVEQAQQVLQKKLASGELQLPTGVSYRFAGSYENQVRSEQRLRLILPLALLVIFLILYFQFRRVSTSLMVFSGILVAWSGGFILIGLYGWSGFLDMDVLGVNLRELFQISPVNLSVAVWVGFLALFGIATDDGVLMATYMDQLFAERKPDGVAAIREATVEAAQKRVRPALMTAATTILALLPVLASTGRGADIMIPMAIPSFGGMILAILTLFAVPMLYCWREEYSSER